MVLPQGRVRGTERVLRTLALLFPLFLGVSLREGE